MSNKKLLVVESPTKVKTISKFLGKDFVVKASKGHVKDLPANELAVDTENNFTPKYKTIKGKGPILKELKELAKKVDEIYLAPDPDREGEAIAWHIAKEIKKSAGNKPIRRAVFNEITKNAVLEAINNPTDINENLFNSQQARRILDRLVGYKLSPLLWTKVKRGLSAGRVQSIAVKILCTREDEIKKFVPEEFWTIKAEFENNESKNFWTKLVKENSKKIKVGNKEKADEIVNHLKSDEFLITKITKKPRKNNPQAPFITSRLQQEAARRFGISPKRTMMIAQQLYEGIDIDSMGSVGLITYMRTDSVRVSKDAVSGAISFITKKFGEEYLPKKPNFYKNKNASQDAHEAIRPTNLSLPPEKIKNNLDPFQYKIYKLIWERFIASQMAPAQFDQTTITVDGSKHTFTATGSVLIFKGYLAVYNNLEKSEDEKEDSKELPKLKEGEKVKLKDLKPEQNFTKPPPRFTEGTLVRELEDKEIGRPSTYATIISTIQDRGYVEKQEKLLVPTDLGCLITSLLDISFKDIMDISFTAELEKKLDLIEEGKVNWIEQLKEFYTKFEHDLATAKTEMKDIKKEGLEKTDEICPKCNSPLVVKYGRFGKFLACSNYPECKFTKPLPQEIVKIGEKCPDCGKELLLKRGKGGVRFIACENYPECKYTRSYSSNVKCPECNQGELVEKVSGKGKIFYACNKYPQCKFAIWDEPVNIKCSSCDNYYLVKKRRKGSEYYQCPDCKKTYKKEEIEKK